MPYHLIPMNAEYAKTITTTWAYGGQFAIYDYTKPDEAAHVSDPGNWGTRVFAVLDGAGDLIGECTITRDLDPDDELWFGFGLRPNLTGQGRGPEFVDACVKFAVDFHQYPGEFIRLGVAAFNKRAIRCYQKAGFEEFRRHTGEWGEFKGLEIIHMRKKITSFGPPSA